MKSSDDSARKTVDKAMRLLHAFSAEHAEYSIGELSLALEMHKSVVSRLASSLRDWGMLEKDEQTQRLRIGAGAFRLGALYTRENHLIRIAKSRLESLVQETGQSVHLTVLDGLRVLVVATAESPNALRVIMRLGDYRHLHTTAAGKLFLSLGPESLRNHLAMQTDLPQITSETISDPQKLHKALKKIQKEKLAWNRGENTVGAGAVAAPVFDGATNMVAAVSVVYPLHVVNADLKDRMADAVTQAAASISEDLNANHRIH